MDILGCFSFFAVTNNSVIILQFPCIIRSSPFSQIVLTSQQMHCDSSHLGKNSGKKGKNSKTLCPLTPCSSNSSTSLPFFALHLFIGGRAHSTAAYGWKAEDNLPEESVLSLHCAGPWIPRSSIRLHGCHFSLLSAPSSRKQSHPELLRVTPPQHLVLTLPDLLPEGPCPAPHQDNTY